MRKGQIKMFETIAVMIVFFFLLAFGLSFYFVIAKAGAQKEHDRTMQLQAIQSVQRISNLPEFDCVKVGVQIENCFDEFKVAMFSQRITDRKMRDYYFEVFGFVTVELKKLFPLPQLNFTIYDNPRPNSGFDLTMLPVLVYSPVTDEFSFGVLEVKFYET